MSSFDYQAVQGVINNRASEDLNYLVLDGTDERVCKVGTVTMVAGSTSPLVVTGVGFQPECLLMFGATTINTSGGDVAALAFGVATGATEQWGMSLWADDNVAGRPRVASWSETELVHQSGSGATVAYSAALQSFDADGFTLDVNTAGALAWILVYVALAGGGSYKAGVSTIPTSAGTLMIDPGFVADAVLFGTTGRTSASVSTNYSFSIGAADAAMQNAVAVSADNNVVFTTTRQELGQAVLITRTGAGGGNVQTRADVVTLNNGGEVELDFTTVDGSAYKLGWLALQNAEMGRMTADISGAVVEVATVIEEPMGLITFETCIRAAADPDLDGIPDVNGWVAGASIGISAVDEGTEPEWTASIQDLSSPPFGVIQTRRQLRADSFGCFRHAGGGLIVGTDSAMVHPLDVTDFGTDAPQIYRRVIQLP